MPPDPAQLWPGLQPPLGVLDTLGQFGTISQWLTQFGRAYQIPVQIGANGMSKKKLTMHQVVTKLGIGRATLYRWIERRDFPQPL